MWRSKLPVPVPLHIQKPALHLLMKIRKRVRRNHIEAWYSQKQGNRKSFWTSVHFTGGFPARPEEQLQIHDRKTGNQHIKVLSPEQQKLREIYIEVTNLLESCCYPATECPGGRFWSRFLQHLLQLLNLRKIQQRNNLYHGTMQVIEHVQQLLSRHKSPSNRSSTSFQWQITCNSQNGKKDPKALFIVNQKNDIMVLKLNCWLRNT